MCNKNLKILSCMVLVTGALSGLAGCSCMPSKPIQTEEKTITSAVDDAATECDADVQDQKGTSMQMNRILGGGLKAWQEIIPVWVKWRL